MLTLFKRHLEKCKFTSRRNKSCDCPMAVEGRLNGVMIRRSLEVRSWEAAKEIVREWEKNGIKTTSLADAYDRYLDDHESKGSAPDTLMKHRQMKKDAVEFFGDRSLKSISVDDVGKFMDSMRHLAPGTRANTLNRLRSFFYFCMKREWVEKNPAKNVESPKIKSVDRKPYSPEEIETIFRAVDQFPNWGIYGEKTRERLRAFITVLRWTGLRIGDVVQLEASKIVDGNVKVKTTKNGNWVSIPLHPDALAALEKAKNGNRFFFWSGEGTVKSAVSAWERTMKRLYKITRFRCNCHRFRHNVATELLAKGVSIENVASILGNTPAMIVKVYGQWIPARQLALDAAVKATWA